MKAPIILFQQVTTRRGPSALVPPIRWAAGYAVMTLWFRSSLSPTYFLCCPTEVSADADQLDFCTQILISGPDSWRGAHTIPLVLALTASTFLYGDGCSYHPTGIVAFFGCLVSFSTGRPICISEST